MRKYRFTQTIFGKIPGTGEELLLKRAGVSEVKTLDKAAIAAAICEPWLDNRGFGREGFVDTELNAEDNDSHAEALWVGPLWFGS